MSRPLPPCTLRTMYAILSPFYLKSAKAVWNQGSALYGIHRRWYGIVTKWRMESTQGVAWHQRLCLASSPPRTLRTLYAYAPVGRRRGKLAMKSALRMKSTSWMKSLRDEVRLCRINVNIPYNITKTDIHKDYLPKRISAFLFYKIKQDVLTF